VPILLTGFEPYGGRSENPSQEIVRALDGRLVAGETVVGRILPVALAGLADRIARVLDEVAPRAVISLGLCPGEPVIRIERLGVNIADFAIPDNAGAKLAGEVVAGGSPARLSTFPADEIKARLLEAGIPARLSMSAGTYLCNACLYLFLEALHARSMTSVPCGFIHLPYTADQRLSFFVAASMPKAGLPRWTSRMVKAVEIAAAATIGRALPDAPQPSTTAACPGICQPSSVSTGGVPLPP